MAGWYVRRGEKIVGPVDSAKLKELAAGGRVLPTDQLAKDAAGPWTEAGRTSLFAKKPQAASVPATVPPEPERPALVPTVERVAIPKQPNGKTNRVSAAFSTVGRGTLAAGGVVFRSLSARSQRRHELKLAKLQAKASTAPQPTAAPAQVVQAMPSINITNVNTNVVNNSGRKRWSRLVAFFLSCLLPGLGQLYKGQTLRAVIWFVVVGIGYVALIIPGVILHVFCAIGATMGDPYR